MDLTAVFPFEPISATRIPSGDQWIAQIKWDGVRMLSYFDGHRIRLFNRRRNERTLQYPELLRPYDYCRSSSFILDGELIAFDADKPSFHEIMKRDSIRNLNRAAQVQSQVPVTYMIFDVLYNEGEWVTGKPLSVRQRLLQEIILPRANVQIVQNFSDADGLLQVMRAHRMEGIVLKDKQSDYSLAGKDGRWRKFKIFHDLHAVIGGVIIKHNIVSSMLLGLYDEHGSLHYIGHSGMGKLTGAETIELTKQAIPLFSSSNPFGNTPERADEAVWLTPRIIVKIQFMEWTRNRTMRHPSMQSIVHEVKLTDCTFKQLN